MKSAERILVALDSWPWSAVSRVALGLIIPPIFHAFSGDRDSIWISLALFIGLLAVLRLVPAVLRHALPFSAEAQAIWVTRRITAKEHDCYQWQKLFWIGLGLLLYALIGGGLTNGDLAVASICLIGGGAGLLFWQRVKATRPASKPS
jgi:hypothetical protein